MCRELDVFEVEVLIISGTVGFRQAGMDLLK